MLSHTPSHPNSHCDPTREEHKAGATDMAAASGGDTKGQKGRRCPPVPLPPSPLWQGGPAPPVAALPLLQLQRALLLHDQGVGGARSAQLTRGEEPPPPPLVEQLGLGLACHHTPPPTSNSKERSQPHPPPPPPPSRALAASVPASRGAAAARSAGLHQQQQHKGGTGVRGRQSPV